MIGKVFKVIDGFDYENNPCKLIENTITNEQYSTENALEANSLCEELNRRDKRINDLYWLNEDLIEDNEILEAKNKQINRENSYNKLRLKSYKKALNELIKENERLKEEIINKQEVIKAYGYYTQTLKEY